MIPSLFVVHGAPSLAIEQNSYTRFLEELGTRLPRPRAIVLFSAHWEAPVQMISGVDRYGMIYDFSGFSPELYRMVYPAKGDVALAEEIAALFRANGVPCRLDGTRGLDHGAWVVLRLLYPEADIPVVALSVNPHLAPEEQYRIGKVLAPLKEKGVLIIGSGGTVHNLRMLDWERDKEEKEAGADWAGQFDDWLQKQLTDWNTEELFRYEERAPHARRAVPTTEHFVPLLIAMGAGDEKRQGKRLYHRFQFGTLSLSCWQFS